MQYKDFHFTLDISMDTFVNIKTKQGETGVKLYIQLTHDEQMYSLANTSVNSVFSKPDKTVSYIPCTIEDRNNGSISIVLTNQILAVHGVVDAEIQVTGDKGLVKSWTFPIVVEPSVGETEIESSNELTVLDEALERVETFIQNEQIRIANEDKRILDEGLRADSELLRVAAEGDRETAEQAREADEDARKVAESNRETKESERTSSEQTRQAEEETRVLNENLRISQEDARESSEQDRRLSETSREDKEEVRITNEDARELSESSRKSSEDTRVLNEQAREVSEAEREDSESTRIINESNRESSESQRKTSEQTRQSQESARITTEQERKDAEAIRASSEQDRRLSETGREDRESVRVANEDARELSESSRKSSEDTRVLNEQARETAEVDREDSESIRTTNESARETSESQRKTSEQARQSEEDTRVLNEKLRISQEDARESSEDVRLSNEADRVIKESQRVQDEQARESNELIRQDSESTRVLNEDNRILSEDARNTSEVARKDSEVARENSEGLRVSSESTRKVNEDDRIAKENARVTSENDRVASEDTRKTNEAARKSGESTRQRNETTRENNEAIRQANMQIVEGWIANPQQFNGKDLEYDWNGTQLGVRLKGDTTFQYVDLKGDTGGVEDLTEAHVISALGYVPLDENNLPDNIETTIGSQAKADQAEQNAKTYADTELGKKIDISQKGIPHGVAELDEVGNVPSSQLPSYVDDVLEYSSKADFPSTGESGKIYVAKDTNLTYRWTGSNYVEISPSIALGETSSTAYRGDRGKTAYDHSQITHDKNLVGLGNVDNVKQASKAEFDAHNVDTTKHVSNTERGAWNAKETTTGSQAKADQAEQNAKDYTDQEISSIDIPDSTWESIQNKPDTFAPSAHSHTIGNITGLQNELDSKETPSGSQAKANQAESNAKSYVDGKVLTDVPLNAKFTDTNTTYSEISTAEIDAGTSSTLRTITGRRIKYILDKVQGWINALTKSDVGLSNVDNVKQATKVEFDSHNANTTMHITSAERTNWNSKETTSGAQAKADTAEDNAKSYVDGKVLTDVPANAKFTDTVYTHPSSHPASMITESSTKRFVSDSEKSTWNSSIIPTGLISMWSGSIISIPSGWALCDGNSGTPDLRDRFIVGAGNSYDVGDTGGLDSVTLDTSDIPYHRHDSGTLDNSSSGGHSHTASSARTGSHSHGSGTLVTSEDGGHSHSASSGSAGSHSHGIGTLEIDSVGSHTHGSGTYSTGSAGSHSHSSGTLSTSTTGAHTHSFKGTTRTVYEKGTYYSAYWASSSTNTGSAGSHSHNISGSTASTGSHSHSVSGTSSSGGSHSHDISGRTASGGSHSHSVSVGSVVDHSHSVSGSTSSSGSHSHTITVDDVLDHTHSISGYTGYVGSSSNAHENRPPYFALAFIMKL